MQSKEFQVVKNPYIVGNPIKSQDMFFGRDKDFAIIKEWIVTDGLPVILLIGSRRSGKTSILMQIKVGRMDDVCESVFFDCNAVVPKIKKDADFSEEIGKSILSNEKFKQFAPLFYDNDELTSRARLKILIDACINNISPKKLVILFDEIESLEKVFEDSVLTRNALSSIDDILTKPVFFVMTSSGGFSEKNIGDVFGHITQQKAIHELAREDTYNLIKKPVEDVLSYSDEVVDEIYRLSGGKTFFTQHICHTVVNHVNAQLKRSSIDLNDLGEVVDFIVSNPVGHIQESWKKYSDLHYCPKNTLHFLACLATSIENSNEYVDNKKLLQTQKLQNFKFEKNELSKIIAWFKKNSRLIEWSAKGYRFRIDLLRIWIAHYYQTGEDIEEYLLDSVNPRVVYTKKLSPLLKKQNISYSQRVELDKLQVLLDMSYEATEEIEVDLRTDLKLRSINWAQEYESSCLYIKNKFSDVRGKDQLKLINKTYIDSGRLSSSVAKEIRQRTGIKGSYNRALLASVALIGASGLLVGSSIFFLGNKDGSETLILEEINPEQAAMEGSSVVVGEKKNDNASNSHSTETSVAVEVKDVKPSSHNITAIQAMVERRQEAQVKLQNEVVLPAEEIKFIQAMTERLAQPLLTFSEAVDICREINGRMNEELIHDQRALYINAVIKSLDFISSSEQDEEQVSWLEVQKNNIEQDSNGRYVVKDSFKTMLLEQERLYGSFSTSEVPVELFAIIQGNNGICNKDARCELPLDIDKLQSGQVEVMFTNEKIGVNVKEVITLYPNQHYHLIVE